jgi:DNA-binding protein YbaB
VTEIRNFDELAEYAERQVKQLGQMQSELAAGSGEGKSPRGYVRARTGPGGQLQDLRIDPTALRLTAEELEAEVATAIVAAQNQYSARADDIMAPVLGMRPSEQALAQLEEGMAKLDSLAADLDRIARQRGLAG